MARIGRPLKFTDARQQVYLKALEDGLTRTAAASRAGVGYSTVSDHRATSRDFSAAEETAEATAEARMTEVAYPVGELTKADARVWLERRRPDDWGKRESIRVSGDPEAPVTFDWWGAIGVPPPGSVGDPDPSGTDQGAGDGQAVGEDGPGGGK